MARAKGGSMNSSPASRCVSGIQLEKPDPEKLDALNVRNWPTWEKQPSTLECHYGEGEVCYFLDGDVTVRTAEGEVSLGRGDLVTFPAGLSCTWRVNAPVRKAYRFG
jgi:uncharacterized cupin superfamily protein